ncbi:S-locus-specific glycoprotein S6-like [Neltuma alba]|uniref:S-locus-specific glycoprotein S6-like n=1 Tax=Neltuma alba TaxID=207710 RepID=UPI0010A45F7A|nr:S-locus-specific glycoprotein S6-like [Prosopis alba]
MAIPPCVLLLTNLLTIFLLPVASSSDINIITQSQPLVDDGRTTLVSDNGKYEVGFFGPGSRPHRYIGIWFKSKTVRTVVWVANRENPMKHSSGKFIINKEGNLVLVNNNDTLVWLANSTGKASSPIVQLLGSGNLVLRDEKDQNPENYMWQSFDYPSDTLLPGMKVGWNLRTGPNRYLTAWKNWDDPSAGDFRSELMLHNLPEKVFWQGLTEYYRISPWNGVSFSGSSAVNSNIALVSKG